MRTGSSFKQWENVERTRVIDAHETEIIDDNLLSALTLEAHVQFHISRRRLPLPDSPPKRPQPASPRLCPPVFDGTPIPREWHSRPDMSLVMGDSARIGEPWRAPANTVRISGQLRTSGSLLPVGMGAQSVVASHE